MDNNLSDFDNSDEDLASLLADDDDIFTKKPFGNSPAKKATANRSDVSPEKSVNLPIHGTNRQEFPEKNTFKQSPIKHTLSKNISKEMSDTDDDALNDLLSDSSMPSFLKDEKRTPVKKNVIKTSEGMGDESKYLDDLGFTQLSSETAISRTRSDSVAKSKSSLSEEGDNSEDDDILKSLESDDKGPVSQKRKGSFFDDFLKTLSPKQSPKKSPLVPSPSDQLEENEEDPFGENIFGKFSSPKSKSSNPSTQKHSTPENKKEHFHKQVSFKDLPVSESKNESPVREKIIASVKTQPEPELKISNKTASQPKRSERMGASKTDDTDWLTFFKESPKKTKKPTETENKAKASISEEKDVLPNDFKLNASRRRSSSAEWLGLNESNISSNTNAIIDRKNKLEDDEDPPGSGEPLKLPRPHTTGSSNISRPRRNLADDLSWLGEDTKKDSTEIKKKLPDSMLTLKDSKNLSDEDIYNEDRDSELISKGHTSMSQKSSFISRKEQTSVIQPQSKADVFSSEKNIPEVNTVHRRISDKPSNDTDSLRTNANIQDIVPEAKKFYVDEKSQNLGGSNDFALQVLINNHALERDQLMKSSEAMKLMYEERIKTIENLHKDEIKSLEESLKSLETRLNLEMDDKVKTHIDKLNVVKHEKLLLEKDFKEKLDLIEKQNLSEVQRLKELHGRSIESMKKDHEDALFRLQRLKEQEIEAVLSTQSHSRSLQHLTDQLEARTSELASLQIKVEDRNQATLREKQVLLEAKERDLKNMQNRLQRQLEDGDEERSRLQQLVLRLESRLQKNTTEGEEERWEVQQLKARLSVQQKYLDEEYKLHMQQVEREKDKLRLSQDSLLHEQKTVLLQLAHERQQLMQEKVDIDLLSKRIKEEETKFHVKKLKEESYIERQKMFIQQEESRLQFEKANVKHEAELLERERDTLQIERQMLKDEKMKFSDFSFKIKRKENEAEAMATSAAEERERAEAERASTAKIKSEQQARMQQITQKMQALMEKEHQILAEKEKLSEEKLELDNKRNSILCNKCKLSLGFPLNAPPSGINPMSLNSVATPVNPINIPFNPSSVAAYPLVNGISNHVFSPRIDPSLVVWYITAKKDREYLQGELAFLKSLKDSKKK